MLVNSSNNQKNIEIKLINLYEEHNKMSVKIIELLNHISRSIDEGNGAKLENYSLIEKEFLQKLLKIKKIISGFEKNCSVFSEELIRARKRASSQQDIIITLGRNNRNILKNYLKRLSVQIENISRKVLYSPSVSKQLTPQFVDFNI
ncbi:MAG: hypothetical protein DRP58_07820 [Spirochaetes bacterium]|nr:MAG: hypothetical protein DRP58_07820 [Spirochaetota bacterium]